MSRCIDCPSPITRQSRSGRCRPCTARRLAHDPVKREKCRAKMRAHFAEPEAKARHLAAMDAGKRRRLAEPAFMEALREGGRALNLRSVEAALGWCPASYRHMVAAFRKKRFPATEIRAIVTAQIRADKARATPSFARAMERVRNGASITETAPIRRADHPYTLAGGSPL